MAKKLVLWLAVGAVLAAVLAAALAAPAPAYADDQSAATPTITPAPLTPAKVGSNAHLAIGALVLVVIILLGVGLNFRRKK
jgi:hypothetical protein